jgi:hypothetical protein
MLTGELRSQIDRIWDSFWTGGISNPLEVMEQITYGSGKNLGQVACHLWLIGTGSVVFASVWLALASSRTVLHQAYLCGQASARSISPGQASGLPQVFDTPVADDGTLPGQRGWVLSELAPDGPFGWPGRRW